MRCTLGSAAVLAVLLLAYAIWPVVCFFWIHNDAFAEQPNLLLLGGDLDIGRDDLLGQQIRSARKSTSLASAAASCFDGGSEKEQWRRRGVKAPPEFAPFSQSTLKSGW